MAETESGYALICSNVSIQNWYRCFREQLPLQIRRWSRAFGIFTMNARRRLDFSTPAPALHNEVHFKPVFCPSDTILMNDTSNWNPAINVPAIKASGPIYLDMNEEKSQNCSNKFLNSTFTGPAVKKLKLDQFEVVCQEPGKRQQPNVWKKGAVHEGAFKKITPYALNFMETPLNINLDDNNNWKSPVHYDI